MKYKNQCFNLVQNIFSGLLLPVFIISCSPSQAFHPSSYLSTPISSHIEPEKEFTNVYHVDANLGADNNPGTKEKPWKTIQRAANEAPTGSVVQVSAGYYPERVQVANSGTKGNQITYLAVGHVITKGFTVKANFITIKGFEITDTSDTYEDGVGIFVQGSHCNIENNYIHDATRGGILLFAISENYSETSNCVVRENRLYHNSQKGIDVRGENHLVEQNEIWGTIQYHPKWLDPPDTVDADGIRFFGSGHIFSKNFIHDITYSDPENISPHIDCFQTWDGPDFVAGNNIVFEKNICINMENNGGEETGKGFMLENAKDILIRNNIIRGYFGVFAIDAANLMIVNNTIAYDVKLTGPDDYPSAIQQINTKGSIVKNNIFFDYRGVNVNWAPLVSEYKPEISNNLFYQSDNTPFLDMFYAGNLWGVDPQFVDPIQNDFHLRLNSPGIDTGIILNNVTDDFNDVKRPQGDSYDIGAYESVPPQ